MRWHGHYEACGALDEAGRLRLVGLHVSHGPAATSRPALLRWYTDQGPFARGQTSPGVPMKAFVSLLLAALLAVSLAGCGNDKEKGINKDRDMPRSGEKPR